MPVVFEAVLELCPRDDRHANRRVFEGVTADRLRMSIRRACVGVGVPVFSPHDLRHRRISLWHLAGVPWARIGEHVGQRDLAVTANTYTHVLSDRKRSTTRRFSNPHALIGCRYPWRRMESNASGECALCVL